MDWTSVGLGLGNAVRGGVQTYQADQAVKRQQAKEEAERALENKRIELQQMLAKVADDRYEQGRRDDKAQQVASTMDPWSEVDDDTAATMEGTPYEGRVSKPKTTLPSSFGDPLNPSSDPGGRSYRVWTPTAAEMRQRAQTDEADRDRDQARADAKQAREDARTDRITARADADADRERTREESFDDWVKRETWQRAHPAPSQSAGGKDDPELPRGVEDYLYDLSRRQGNTFEGARSEVDATWAKLVKDHPKLSRAKVNQALRSFFQADPKPTTDPMAGLGLEDNTPTPTGGRGRGAGPLAAGVGGVSPSGGGQPRTVTAAQVKAVAAKNGTTVEEERRRAEAEGFVIR